MSLTKARMAAAIDALRTEVCRTNRDLVSAGLILLSFGNASAVDREAGLIAIKPSGVPYDALQPEDIVVLGLEEGQLVAGRHRPSSDAPAHLDLYRRFPTIGGVVHTHSRYATSWAQAGLEIPCLGTTHADHFRGSIPVTRPLSPDEIAGDYEANTGVVIVERFAELDPDDVPGVLVSHHGPFSWGPTPAMALANAVALEAIAQMALQTLILRPGLQPIPDVLRDRHFARKHGETAYYGQDD